MRYVLSILFSLALISCTPNTRVSYRLIDLESPAAASDFGTIGLRDVHLPEYWNDRRIPVSSGGSEIERSNGYMLAENPTAIFYEAFRTSLQQHNTSQIFSAPWPPEVKPAHKVEIYISNLIGEYGGTVELDGFAYILGTKNEQVRFSVEQPMGDTTMESYLNSISIAIDTAVTQMYSSF